MNPENVPDLTISELREMDEEEDEYSLSDEDYEEMREHYEDMWLMTQFTAMAMTLGQLLMEDRITYRKYIEHIEWVEDLAAEEDVQLP